MVERREPRAAAAPPRREPQRRAPPTVTIDRALLDRNLLGAGLGDAASWQTWLVVLRAAFALDLSAAERAIFTSVAGERAVPTKRVNELWCLVSRNGGKSRIAAALAVYFSIFTPRTLAAGERGIVLVLAASTAQAQTVFHYALGFLQASPVLRAEISSLTTTEIRLRNHTTIAVAPNSYRTVRGRTLQACICDEISFWGDESSATPDVEAYRAVLPALARTNGMLVGISTGYKRAGLLHEKWRDHYGVDGDAVLVVQGASRAFNPTLDAAVIAAACAADPEAAAAEWQGGFRDDICGVFDDALIAAAVELQPSARTAAPLGDHLPLHGRPKWRARRCLLHRHRSPRG